jgi:hypothetical protein
MAAYHEHLERSTVGVFPNPLKLARALLRPNQRFVMINALVFKQQATGDFSHLTGQEAYELYAQSVQKAQGPLGSRLLWSGQIVQKMSSGIAPNFHAIAFLEYASPRAFLQFLTRGGSNSKARSAGLDGQWLIASTTLEADPLSDSLSDGLVLVEFLGGTKQGSETRKRWDENRQLAYPAVGAKMLWFGRCDHHIIGAAAPRIENVLASWFPDTSALEQVLGDLQGKEHLQCIQPYLAYTAQSMTELLPELR